MTAAPWTHPRDRARAGFALPMALILLTFLFTMGLALSQIVVSDWRSTFQQGYGIQAHEAAETGLARGLWTVYAGSPASPTGSESRSYATAAGTLSAGAGRYAISIAEDTAVGSSTFGDLTIQSAGSVSHPDALDPTRTLAATLPNLGNDDDGSDITPPLVVASSEMGGFPAVDANDGNPSSQWVAAEPAGGGHEEWLEVDLGSTRAIRKVVLDLPDGRIRDYAIQTHDGSSWQDVTGAAAWTANPAPGHRILAVVFDIASASRMRLLVKDSTAEPAVNEIQVYPPAEGAALSE